MRGQLIRTWTLVEQPVPATHVGGFFNTERVAE